MLLLKPRNEVNNMKKPFKDLICWSQNHQILITVESLQLTSNYRNGVVGFITKLENTYMDLEYCTKVKKSAHKKKAKLLQAIVDAKYINAQDMFSTMDKMTFEECLNKLIQLGTMFGS